MTRKITAALLTAALAGACVEEEETVPVPWPSIDGVWTVCQTEQEFPKDEWETFLIDGTTFQRVHLEYESSDGTCTGAVVHASVDEIWDWNITLGTDVATTLAGAPVTARALDAARITGSPPGGDAYYTLLYVDDAGDPDALYLGNPMDPEKDGSTPDLRPTGLWESRPYAREAPSGFDIRDLRGSWEGTCLERNAQDSRSHFKFEGYRVIYTETYYSSIDRTCTGDAMPMEMAVPVALRGEVPATLNGDDVTAREIDVGGPAPFYQIMYLDRSVTPNVLYVGDDVVDPARDSRTPGARPNVLWHGMPLLRQ